MEFFNIEKLATMARIKLNNQEKDSLKNNIETILNFVAQINTLTTKEEKKTGDLYNITREDSNVIKQDEYTEKILQNAPSVKNRFIEVKKVIITE